MTVQVELVLTFHADVDPRPRRMKVEMARTELHAVVGLDGCEVCQHPTAEMVDLDRAGVHWAVIRRVVAAGDHDHMRVVRRGADLVRVFAGIKRIRLAHLFTQRAVAVDPMHGERARVVIGGQQKLARQIEAGVNGARRQTLRLTVRRERARCGVDPQCMSEIPVAAHPGTAAARYGIKVRAARRMRPRVLHVRRQDDAAAPRERGGLYIQAVPRELASDAGIECRGR